MFLGIVFICSMKNVVCFCAASLVGKVVRKETVKRVMRKLRRQRVSLDVRGIVVRRSLAKVLFAVGGNKLWSHREFCASGGFGGEACVVSIKVAQR